MVSKPQSAVMYPGPGFRIRSDVLRPDPDVVAGFGAFDTPAISDRMNRLYTMSPGIRNLTDERLKIVGPACTVKVYPGDNLMVHKALDIAKPGDIIVGDAIGVVVIPQEIAADLLSRLQASASRESDYASAVARGDFSNDWVDALLDESGIELDGRSAEGSKAGS